MILFTIYACMACAMRTAGQASDLQFAAALIFPLFVFGLRRIGRPHGSTVSILKVVLAFSILATLFLAGTLSVQSSALMAALWFGLQVKLPKSTAASILGRGIDVSRKLAAEHIRTEPNPVLVGNRNLHTPNTLVQQPTVNVRTASK